MNLWFILHPSASIFRGHAWLITGEMFNVDGDLGF